MTEPNYEDLDYAEIEQRIRDAYFPEMQWRDPFEEARLPGESRQECKERLFRAAYPEQWAYYQQLKERFGAEALRLGIIDNMEEPPWPSPALGDAT